MSDGKIQHPTIKKIGDHVIPAGAVITHCDIGWHGGHIEYQNGSVLTRVDIKFEGVKINDDGSMSDCSVKTSIRHCDAKDIRLAPD